MLAQLISSLNWEYPYKIYICFKIPQACHNLSLGEISHPVISEKNLLGRKQDFGNVRKEFFSESAFEIFPEYDFIDIQMGNFSRRNQYLSQEIFF